LVGNTVREVGKPLRSSYKAKIIQLKARGFDNKVAQVTGLNIQVTIIEDQLGELYIKLEKAQKLIKQLKNGIIKSNTAILTKKKGK
jgi:hypothetical protein